MQIDKKTGDIIFDDNIVLKAEMTVDGMKNSNVKKLLSERSLKEIDNKRYLVFKPIDTEYGKMYIDVGISMISNSINKITISFEEDLKIYDTGINNDEFKKLIKQHEKFLKENLQLKDLPNNLDFKWGYIEIEANINIPLIEIDLYYMKLKYGIDEVN
ncbi:hypothetical protein [Clostridium guangxiense]|uniref:hypothetical protein n=1 Tax=Clostridium guangxiense TaxID=1662055 RepID=UPI001E56FF20|nr:hypothetical protein [Clostridium guangxiense]MCD2348821.1 hypothetical protein [Clostridium guangxiense]